MSKNSTTDNPTVFCECLHTHTQGGSRGNWIEIHPDMTLEQLQVAVKAILAPSGEEWFFPTSEGFGGISEHQDLQSLIDMSKGLHQHGNAFRAYLNECKDRNDPERQTMIEHFEESYLGSADSREAYAGQVMEVSGLQAKLEDMPVSIWGISGSVAELVKASDIAQMMDNCGYYDFCRFAGTTYVFNRTI